MSILLGGRLVQMLLYLEHHVSSSLPLFQLQTVLKKGSDDSSAPC